MSPAEEGNPCTSNHHWPRRSPNTLDRSFQLNNGWFKR